MGSVTFKDDVFDDEFFRANARALFDGSVNGFAVDTLLFRLLDSGKKAWVHARIRPAHFGGDGDFAHEFGRGPALFEAGDQSFGMEPLTSHAASYQRGATDSTVGCGGGSGWFHIGVMEKLGHGAGVREAKNRFAPECWCASQQISRRWRREEKVTGLGRESQAS